MPSIKYIVRVGRLSFGELWVLGQRSISGFAMLLPAKLLGATIFDRELTMHFGRGLGIGVPLPPRQPRAVEKILRSLESAGFSHWGTDKYEAEGVCLVSHRRAGVLAQVGYASAGPPILRLVSFTRPRLTVTANGELGIRGGGVADTKVLRNASVAEVIREHSRRTVDSGVGELTENDVVQRIDEAGKQDFEYNVARGVYEIQANPTTP